MLTGTMAVSVLPITAVALDYTTVQVSWVQTIGGYTAFRLLRNQNGYPIHEEDGIILIDETGINSSTGSMSVQTFKDGYDNLSRPTPHNSPITPGKFIYYRAFVWSTTLASWQSAGQVITIMAKDHPTTKPNGQTISTHDKFMSTIPRVFTSASQTPIDEVDTSSDLYKFMKGFTYTLDETLTLIDTLVPSYTLSNTGPALVDLKANQYGINDSSATNTSNKKRKVSNAIKNYSMKGTEDSIISMVKGITGYDSRVHLNGNILLSPEDGTFYNGVGTWKPYGSATLTSETSSLGSAVGTSISTDSLYSAKVVVASSSTLGSGIITGSVSPAITGAATVSPQTVINTGIPIDAGNYYQVKLYMSTLSGTATSPTAVYINYFDYKGVEITASKDTSSVTTSSYLSYKNIQAPTGAVYMFINIVLQTAGTYYVDKISVVKRIPVVSISSITGTGAGGNNQLTSTRFFSKTLTNEYNNGTNMPYKLGDIIDINGTAAEVISASNSMVTVLGTYTGISYIQMYDGFYHGDARSVKIRLLPNKLNYINDGGSNLPSWTGTGGSWSSVTTGSALPYAGALALSNAKALTTTSSTAFSLSKVPITFGVAPSGVYVTFSVYARVTTGSNLNTSVYIQGYSSDSWPTSVISSTVTATLTTTWQRFQTTLYVPKTTTSYNNFSYLVGISGTGTGQIVEVSSPQLENTYSATDYFQPGVTPNTFSINNITSANFGCGLYRDITNNIELLKYQISNILPINTPYVITAGNGSAGVTNAYGPSGILPYGIS